MEAHPCDSVTREMMVDYFSSFVNSVGKIATYFQHWADTIGPGCKNCNDLGAWFSRSVDAAKTGDIIRIPSYLVPPRSGDTPTPQDIPEKVWVTMLKLAKEKKEELNEDVTDAALSDGESILWISEEFIRNLLENTDRGMSEYKAFCLLYKWCDVQKLTETERRDKLIGLSDYINFGMLTMKERIEAIHLGVPTARVINALNKSKLLDKDMLRHFSLDLPSCGWKFYFRERSADFNWSNLFRAIKGYAESLLVLQLRNGLIEYRLAFHFNGEFEEGETVVPAGSLTCYLFSPQFGYRLRYVTDCEYNLNLTHDVIQVYKGDLNNTFFWLESREEENHLLKYDRVSIDLKRFSWNIKYNRPRIRKMNFSTIEVFVRNARLEDIAYLDIHYSEQTDGMTPHVEDTAVSLEDIPSEDEEEREHSTAVPDSPLLALKTFAKLGDSKRFHGALELVTEANEETTGCKLIESFLSLLETMVVKYSHKTSTQLLKSASEPQSKLSADWPPLTTGEQPIDAPVFSETADTDMIQLSVEERYRNLANKLAYVVRILSSPLIELSNAKAMLLVYSNLSKLHLYQLIKEHVATSIGQIKITTIAQYFECVFNWEWWSFLPLPVSCQLSNRLYLLALELESVKIRDSCAEEETALASLADLSTSTEEPPPIDQPQLNYYKCYFAHLMHKHLLIESPNNTDTDKSVSLLRVKPSQKETAADEHTSTDDESGRTTQAKKKSKTWKACFSRTESVNSSDFSLGAYVKIRFMPAADSSHSQDPIAIGCISFSSNSPVSIVVDIPEPVPSCIKRSASLEKGYWSLSLVGNITSLKRARKALETLHAPGIASILVSPEGFPPQLQKQKCDIDFSAKSPEPVEEIEILPNPYEYHTECRACDNRANFNQSQENAIHAALKQRLTLIHGPPGSGKTFVAAEIVHQMCHIMRQGKETEDKLKILVAAETNNASDNLTRKLLDLDMLVLRVGNKNVISKDLHVHSLEHQVEMKRVEQLERKKGQFQSAKLKKEILNSADIIATTCTGAGDNDLRAFRFPFILIDEATQAIEPISLISIVKSCQKLVLVGDPEQLAPTITEEHLPTEKGVPPLKDALCTTLFHRLYTKVAPIFLNEQHRMHPAIADFPSRIFYAGKLRTAVRAEDRIPPDVRFIKKDNPITFINVDSKEFRVGISRNNPGEADVVVEVVKQLIATSEYKVSDIGIITPYAAQAKCIKYSLGNIKVDVHSIDSFQGREKEIIVFSTVRNSEEGEFAFLKDKCRINVLLTRAKRALIGVGNQETLRNSDIWTEWTSTCPYLISETEFNDLIRTKEGRSESRQGRGKRDRYNRHRDREQSYKYSNRDQTCNFNSAQKKISQRDRKHRGTESTNTDHNNIDPIERGAESENNNKYPIDKGESESHDKDSL